MSQTISLGGEGGQSFSFPTIGTSVTGKIIGGEEVQQTDMDTGQPAFWPDGRPKMMLRLQLQTSERDDEHDDGVRSIYLRGSVKPESKSIMSAVREAAKQATGSYDVTIGGTLTVTYVSDGQRTRPGFNPPKQYSAKYQPPSLSLDQQEQAAAQNAPAQQAAQQPQHNGSVIGWINGKPVDAALQAAYANLGVDPTQLPGFTTDPPF